MTRQERIKQLLKEKPPNIPIEEEEARHKIEATYRKRLEAGQHVVSNLLVQAEEAINKLQKKLRDLDVDLEDEGRTTHMDDVNGFTADSTNDLQLKRQSIAMYKTYGKIPFSPDKNDVITIASASTVIHSLLEQYAEASRTLGNNKPVKERIDWMKSSLREYQLLETEIDSLTKEKEEQLQRLRVHGQDQITKASVEAKLEDKLDEAEKKKLLLHRHFDVVAQMYLRFDNLEDKDEGSTLSSLLMEMVASKTKWIGIAKNSPEYNMIQTLLLNDIIIEKQHPETDMVYIALRMAFQ